MNLLKKVIPAISIILVLLTSCSKNEEPTIANNAYIANNNQVNNTPNEEPEDYYFSFMGFACSEIGDSGRRDIPFDFNQSWHVTTEGNIPGFAVAPYSGYGKGYVTISYDKPEWKRSGGSLYFNEQQNIIFHIKEGTENDYREITKTYTVFRKGYKMAL